jgi:hypothetical protein
MRRARNAIAPLFIAAVTLTMTACTPEAQEGVGRTIGQLILWWLWPTAGPHALPPTP